MKFFLITVFLALIVSGIAKEHPQAKLEFSEYCEYFHYPVEKHSVITEDGYILGVYRIQKRGSTIKEGLKPILLQHGLMDSSDTWIVNDEDKAPAFMLANAGYDIWLGNNRGNKHSRHHTSLNPDKDKSYWNFTYQQMSDLDLPATFEYIYSKTNQKMHYLGHSQGTLIMHIALSKRNERVQKYLDKYFAFGPIAYNSYQQSNMMNLMQKSTILDWYQKMGINEFMPSFGWFKSDMGVLFCSVFPKVCADVVGQVMDGDPTLDNYDRYDVIVGHNPSGTSVMNMQHWRQAFLHRSFRYYDYGTKEENMKQYGAVYPPEWRLDNIRVPLRLFRGTSDLAADVDDVSFLWGSLVPEAKSFMQPYPAGHATFMWGKDVSPWMSDLYQFLIRDNQVEQ